MEIIEMSLGQFMEMLMGGGRSGTPVGSDPTAMDEEMWVERNVMTAKSVAATASERIKDPDGQKRHQYTTAFYCSHESLPHDDGSYTYMLVSYTDLEFNGETGAEKAESFRAMNEEACQKRGHHIVWAACLIGHDVIDGQTKLELVIDHVMFGRRVIRFAISPGYVGQMHMSEEHELPCLIAPSTIAEFAKRKSRAENAQGWPDPKVSVRCKGGDA